MIGTLNRKTLSDIFNSEWRAISTIKKTNIKAADEFIKAHYLRKRPAIVIVCLFMEVDGWPVGCITFSAPPRETEIRYGGKTLELSRLYLIDEIPKNAETWFIGKAIKYIRKNFPDIEHLVSYADPSAGHTGIIYKASNWIYDGKTDENRKTPRCDYVNADTGKKYSRKSHIPEGATIIRVPRISKYRFYYNVRGARQ